MSHILLRKLPSRARYWRKDSDWKTKKKTESATGWP